MTPQEIATAAWAQYATMPVDKQADYVAKIRASIAEDLAMQLNEKQAARLEARQAFIAMLGQG